MDRSDVEVTMPVATNEKPDPRIERTRSLLWSTLVALIAEKGYTAVSVQDVTARARFKRSTFYRHYEDKDDPPGLLGPLRLDLREG